MVEEDEDETMVLVSFFTSLVLFVSAYGRYFVFVSVLFERYFIRGAGGKLFFSFECFYAACGVRVCVSIRPQARNNCIRPHAQCIPHGQDSNLGIPCVSFSPCPSDKMPALVLEAIPGQDSNLHG